MRIVSGNFRGRSFQLPKNLKARPTTDFAKENLFNILSNRLDFEELRVLDLFAGTGSIGFEFLSRGVKSVAFVEQYAPHVRFIQEVAHKLNVANCTVVNGDAYRFISSSGVKFDLIFADAPYADEKMSNIPDLIFASGLLAEDGLLLVEHGKATDFSQHPFFKEMRKYGSVHFSFFEKD
ncbi:MAG TPA: 16S rRNA (guanine(966)-N(2))-methyltransferase RsmD [Bacteroidales bacterium]|nr:16S rRNA (guanine(966)-N(2))-methyltransferase RsmD [Bacteroidales bacterium]